MKAPGSSYQYLTEAVMARISGAIAETRLPDKHGEFVAVRVIPTYFDPNAYDETDLPAILVRVTGGGQDNGDQGEERTATVEAAVGVFMEHHGDHEYAVSLMERVEWSLLTERTLDSKYRLKLPLSWTTPERTEQPWPYWWAVMTAVYWLPATAEVQDEDGNPVEI